MIKNLKASSIYILILLILCIQVYGIYTHTIETKEVNSKIYSIKSHVDKLTVSESINSINDLSGKIDDLKNSIDGIESAVNDSSTKIDDIQNQIDDLDKKLLILSDEVSNIKLRLSW